MFAGSGKVPRAWALVAYLGMGVAFMWYWPITLALVSQSAPAKINSTLVSACFLSLFAGLVLMGWVGSFYQLMSPAAFWVMDAGIALAGAVLILTLKPRLTRMLEPKRDHSPG